MTADIFPLVDADDTPWLDTEQMIEVDRIMIDELGIELKQMMENAGRNLAELTTKLYSPGKAVVLAGRGGNGGGGLVAARHLVNRGVEVTVVVAHRAAAFIGVPAAQLAILKHMDLEIIEQDPSAVSELTSSLTP